ncbi:MAG TPA: hypothetical protein VI356_14010 [Myxococcales bacterium]
MPDGGAGPGPLDEAEPGLSSDCAVLAFAGPGVPLVVEESAGMGFGCGSATSDGSGMVALGSVSTNGSTGRLMASTWRLLSPDGSPAGFARGDAPAALLHGFALLDQWENVSAGRALRFSFTEGPNPVQNLSVAVAGDPQGGAIAIEEPFNVEQYWLTAHRFDGAGRQIAPPADVIEGPLAEHPRSFAVGMARDGWSLAVFTGEPQSDGAMLYARWIDPQGTPSGPVLPTGVPAGTTLLLRQLADRSIAVRVDGKWVARVRRSGAERAPAWLAAQDGRDVILLERGYAVPFTYAADHSGCTPAVEIRAPAGNLCGRYALAEPFQRADVGADGTLILAYGGSTFWSCRRRWWSALFR